jgi:hypothetical protein
MALPDFFRGDTWSHQVLTKDLSGNAVDITGRIYTLSLKSDIGSAAPVVQSQVVAGGDDALNGIVTIGLASTQTAALAPGVYYCDIERRTPGDPDDVRTLIFQKVKCYADVS